MTSARVGSADRYDVAVVGGRVAGAATARLLAAAGLDVLVVERAAPGRDTLSTHALMRAGVVQLSRWGLLDRVVASGTPPIRRVTFRYGGEQLTLPVQPSAGVDALYAPRRTVLDAILVDAAAEAGADVHHETALAELDAGRRRPGHRARRHVSGRGDGDRVGPAW